ncbi:hypothetical protein G6Z94_17365 [Vibrio aestuarianus]|uniref:hypothetical protein n=1 Tax=Vibrio aestuarianus TaxID=28171 RepID=UPI001594AA97|nr:hypothetical protein [Vibrio aestuarianus]NGZ19069.1 hypothetical protein [Vibrio aestuarianus]
MKKIYVFTTCLLLLGTTKATAADDSWWRDADNYYKGWVNSPDSDFQAMIRPSDIKSDFPSVEFQMILSHKTFCADKDSSYSGPLTITVNDRKVAFDMTCYKNEWLNIYPSTDKSNDYVLKEFNHYRNKRVTFVLPHKDSPDWVFNFSTKGFGSLYSSIDEYVKDTVQ